MNIGRLKEATYKLSNIGLLVGFLILSVSSFLALNFVMNQFGGYDLSPIIDLSWRLSNHEVAAKDFINTMPLLFILLIKLVSFGHLSWIDLTSANITAVFLTYLLLYGISNLRKCSETWFASVALVISIPLVYTNHLWHSSLSQYSAMIYFYAVYIAINVNLTSKKLFIYIFIGASLVALSKQNISVPILLSVPIFLILIKENNRYLISIATIAGSILGIFLAACFLDVSAEGFIYSYLAILGRTKPDPAMWNAIMAIELHKPLLILSLLLLFLTFFMVAKNFRKQIKRKMFLLLFLILAFIPMVTDWDTKFNNVPFFLFICITAIYYEGFQLKQKFFEIAAIFLLAGILFVSVIGGAVRERMMHVGPFYQTPAEFRIESGYFSGLQAGENFKKLLFEINAVEKKYPLKKIFFGPRIEFSYMTTKTKSPLGMPLWFHPGTSYALNDELRVIETFKKLEFEVLVFAHNDRTRMPAGILEYIQNNFHLENEYEFIDLYIKNPISNQ